MNSRVPIAAPSSMKNGIIQNSASTCLNDPLLTMLAVTVARHGSNTRMTALRMSVVSAMSGVATIGKPSPSAPCTNPASAITTATHSSTPSDRDSNPGMNVVLPGGASAQFSR